MKDEMISKKKFDPGDKFILEIGEKRMALDEYEIVGTDLWVWGSLLEKLTPYEPDHIADVSKKVDADLISRREALEALKALEEKPKALEDDYDFGRRQMLETCIDIIQDLQPSPSAQSEQRWIPCS